MVATYYMGPFEGNWCFYYFNIRGKEYLILFAT